MSTPNSFAIRINGTVFTMDEDSILSATHQSALEQAHRKDVTDCMCTPSAPNKMVVKLYGRFTEAQRYGLARWPGTGLDHDPDCPFFGEDGSAEAEQPTRPAFEELDGGKHRAYLATTLSIIQKNVEAINAGNSKSGKSSPRQRADDVTLLLKLWRTAGLNLYRGNSRKWYNATYLLLKAAEKIIVNKDGDPLSRFLLVGASTTDRLAKEHNAAVLANAAAKYTRLFVIGRLRPFGRDKPQLMLRFQDFNGLPRISVKLDQLDSFLHGRDFYKNIIQDMSGHVIAMACIEPGSNDWWKTFSITGIATSPSMIPVESSYEIEFEQYLTGQSRTFLKPLVLDETRDDVKRPDFILLDTAPRTHIEVWGMQTSDYLANKAKKLFEYEAKGKVLLSWSANPREPMPALPAPRRKGDQ